MTVKGDKMKYLFRFSVPLLATTLIALLTLTPQENNPQTIKGLVSLIHQKSGLEIELEDIGWQWKEEDVKGTKNEGGITFADTKWLMYLIHWGPIQVPEITIEYVKNRMLNMWGVKFEFTGEEGITKIAGHDAVWIEAYGTNKSFYTRFIIWNCHESGREFIADTNYNLRRKTPREDFENEMRSAKTIQCHEGAFTERYPELTRKFDNVKNGLSFYYPENWFFFDSPYYVPFPQYKGIRDRETGSLLALCSDQNLSLTLKWSLLDVTQSEELFMDVEQKTLENLKKEIGSQKNVESFQNHGMEYFTIDSKKITRIWGNCRFREPEDETQRAFYTGKGIYQVAQWEIKKKNKKIIAILITQQFRYGTGISMPTRHFHDKFLRNLVSKIK